MTYSFRVNGSWPCNNKTGQFVNPESDAEYLTWLEAGNTPEPAPEPEPAPALTTEQKLEAAGLTVAELKELFGLD